MKMKKIGIIYSIENEEEKDRLEDYLSKENFECGDIPAFQEGVAFIRYILDKKGQEKKIIGRYVSKNEHIELDVLGESRLEKTIDKFMLQKQDPLDKKINFDEIGLSHIDESFSIADNQIRARLRRVFDRENILTYKDLVSYIKENKGKDPLRSLEGIGQVSARRLYLHLFNKGYLPPKKRK
jgi:hypothetical protein